MTKEQFSNSTSTERPQNTDSNPFVSPILELVKVLGVTPQTATQSTPAAIGNCDHISKTFIAMIGLINKTVDEATPDPSLALPKHDTPPPTSTEEEILAI
ncbi:MAG: hypothetical protein R3A80_11170 [Bdellovibrionota bacterium]